MKLLAPLLAASASANTLLSSLGVYDAIAGTIKNQVSSYLEKASTEIFVDNATLVTAIDDFRTAFVAMDNAVLVNIIENVDVSALLEDGGNFSTDALLTAFQDSEIPAEDLQALQDAFMGALDSDALNSLNASMESALDLANVFKQVQNNEFEASNFVAIYNDFSSAAVNMNDAFGGNLLSGTIDGFLQYGGIFTTLIEKGLVVYEELDSIQTEWALAQTMVEFGVNNRIDDMDGESDDTFMCRAAKTGVFEVIEETFNGVTDIIMPPIRPAFQSSVDLYNDFVHGVPYVGDYYINQTIVDNVFDSIDFYASAAATSMQELNLLLQFIPIDDTMTNMYCDGTA